jgi:hypothetical protein
MSRPFRLNAPNNDVASPESASRRTTQDLFGGTVQYGPALDQPIGLHVVSLVLPVEAALVMTCSFPTAQESVILVYPGDVLNPLSAHMGHYAERGNYRRSSEEWCLRNAGSVDLPLVITAWWRDVTTDHEKPWHAAIHSLGTDSTPTEASDGRAIEAAFIDPYLRTFARARVVIV